MKFRTIFFGLCITVISCKGDNSTTKKSSVVANDTTAVAAQQEEDIYKQQSDTIIFTLDQPVIFPEDIINEGIFRVVEEMPEFPGGIEALQEYLKPKTYILKKTSEQARVVVEFIVDKTGTLYDFKILRSVAPELDAEAIRICQTMPKWIPGKQGGEAVDVRFILPITFRFAPINQTNSK